MFQDPKLNILYKEAKKVWEKRKKKKSFNMYKVFRLNKKMDLMYKQAVEND